MSRNELSVIVCAVIAILSVNSCASNVVSPSNNKPLSIGADESSAEAANIVVNLYEGESPNQLISLRILSRSQLIKGLELGEFDCIFLLGESSLGEYFRIPVANVNATFIVNSRVGLTGIAYEKIREILNGDITNWQQVGGASLQIQPVLYGNSSSEYTALMDLGIVSIPTNAIYAGSNDGVIALVASEAGGVGYVFGRTNYDSVVVLSTGLVQPPVTDIPILFVSTVEPTGELRAILDSALSPEVQAQMASSP